MIVENEILSDNHYRDIVIYVKRYGKIQGSILTHCTVHVRRDGALANCFLINCNLHVPEDKEDRDRSMVLNNIFETYPGNNVYRNFPVGELVRGNYVKEGKKNETG